jgi:hypothetical protein
VSLPGPVFKVSPHDLFMFLDCSPSVSQISRNHFSPLLYIAGVGATCFLPLIAVSALYYGPALTLIVFLLLVEGSFVCLLRDFDGSR